MRLYFSIITQNLISVSAIVLVLLSSCKQTEIITKDISVNAGYYYNGQSDKRIVHSVNEVLKSVNKLDVIAFYKTWHFNEDSLFTKSFITKSQANNPAFNINVTNESTSGTVTTIYSNNGLAGFITCAHILDYPDSVFTYYDDNHSMVKSLSVMVKHQIFISGINSGSPVEIVLKDTKKDLAFLKKEINPEDTNLIPLNTNTGSTNKFEWGTEVYILGYPQGNLMLTKGNVSIDNNIDKRFLSDANFNRGISGSPVFALNNNSNNFDWVGIASSASAKTFTYLRPEQKNSETVIAQNPYFGNNIIDEKILINYGITYSISMEEITIFIARNKSILREVGFDIELLSTNNRN